MNNQPCMVRPTLIVFNPDKLPYYPFIVSLGRCNKSCNTVEDPFGRIYVPSKIEDLNLKVFNILKGMNESKSFLKQISCKCSCELERRKCDSKQK